VRKEERESVCKCVSVRMLRRDNGAVVCNTRALE